MLREQAWDVSVSKQPAGEGGILLVKPAPETLTTRYTLFLNHVPRPDIGGDTLVFEFQLSLVDNASGEEVLALRGFEPESGVVKRLRRALAHAS